MNADIDSVYRSLESDPSFAVVLESCRCNRDSSDEALAELIEIDGRWRLRHGRAVTIERYIEAIPELTSRSDVLDAALEVTLRSMSGSSRIAASAVAAMESRYPFMREAIREAAALNAALWSTTGMRSRMSTLPVLTLPCDFGPTLANGQHRYILRELLGEGSFGRVYRAEDRQLSEEGHPAVVAIKILLPYGQAVHDRHRTLDEATKARRISHPNVVQVLDRGTADTGEDFIVYEFVGGGDLSNVIARTPHLQPRRTAALVAQIARGLHAAHAAGVIHCDLKPSNIMLTPEGQPKIADFGIAVRLGEDRHARRLEHDKSIEPVGNIAFISPEQFRNDESGFNVRSDVYALGGMLYFLLTNALPNGTTREEIARTHDATNGRHVSPSPRQIAAAVDLDLDAICRKALSPRPQDRHDSAASLADDLERWLKVEPIDWMKPSVSRRICLWSRRKPGLAAATAAIVVVSMVGMASAMHFSRQAERNAARAEVKALEAQVAQVKIDEQAKASAEREQLRRVLATSLRDVQNDRRFLTDVLMQVWVYEFIYGPKALGDPVEAHRMWSGRVAAIRSMLDQRAAAGEQSTLEYLLWQQALAFWLTSDGDHAEALPLIHDSMQHWTRMLHANDPWLIDTQTLHRCAIVNQHLAATHELVNTTVRNAQLQTLAHELEGDARRLEATYPRSPLHYLVLQQLAKLHSPRGLNEVEQSTSWREQVRAWLDETQSKAAGVLPSSQQ